MQGSDHLKGTKKVTDRDENGRFVKGYSGGPGRPKREREDKYYNILMTTVTFEDWKRIVIKAVAQAKNGNAVARKWLSDYLVGAPIQRQEITGGDGNPLEVIYVNDWRHPED